MRPAEYLKRPYSRVVVPESDGTFRGEILEFPGCLAAGDTAQETLAKLEDVAASWLESMLARGQQVPEPLEANNYSGRLVLRLAKSVHQKAALAARIDGVSLNYFIANCVAEHVGMRSTSTTQPARLQMASGGSGFSIFVETGNLNWQPRQYQRLSVSGTANLIGTGGSHLTPPDWESYGHR